MQSTDEEKTLSEIRKESNLKPFSNIMSHFYYVLFFLLGCFVFTTHGTKCYVCESVGDSTCADGYSPKNKHITNCKNCGFEDGCTKTKVIATVGGVEVKTVERSCGIKYDNNNEFCQKSIKLSGKAAEINIRNGKTFVCTCTDDLCNGAPATTFQTLVSLIFASVISGYLMKYFIGVQ